MKPSHLVFVAFISLVLLTRHVQAGAHDELAKKFVKLLIAAALLSPPGLGFAPIPLPLPIPVRINVNHEPIIGPPIPHPFQTGLHGGFGGGYGGGLGGLGGIGHGGFGRRR